MVGLRLLKIKVTLNVSLYRVTTWDDPHKMGKWAEWVTQRFSISSGSSQEVALYFMDVVWWSNLLLNTNTIPEQTLVDNARKGAARAVPCAKFILDIGGDTSMGTRRTESLKMPMVQWLLQ